MKAPLQRWAIHASRPRVGLPLHFAGRRVERQEYPELGVLPVQHVLEIADMGGACAAAFDRDDRDLRLPVSVAKVEIAKALTRRPRD